jgi:hypothetical protein
MRDRKHVTTESACFEYAFSQWKRVTGLKRESLQEILVATQGSFLARADAA